LPGVDEIELRIQHINQLEQFWHENFAFLTQQNVSKYRRFYDVQFAALYLMDLQQLKSFATRQTPTDVLYVFLQHLEVIPALIKLATSKRIDKKTKMGGDSATTTAPAAYVKMPPSPDLEPPPQSGTRAAEDVSEVEKNARGELDDYRCVLTKQGFPQVSYIVSRRINNTEQKRADLDQWLPMAAQFFFLRKFGSG